MNDISNAKEPETVVLSGIPSIPKSWKVGIKTQLSDPWSYNGLRFRTKEEAEAWGRDLSFRWTLVVAMEAHPSDDEPNRV